MHRIWHHTSRKQSVNLRKQQSVCVCVTVFSRFCRSLTCWGPYKIINQSQSVQTVGHMVLWCHHVLSHMFWPIGSLWFKVCEAAVHLASTRCCCITGQLINMEQNDRGSVPLMTLPGLKMAAVWGYSLSVEVLHMTTFYTQKGSDIIADNKEKPDWSEGADACG